MSDGIGLWFGSPVSYPSADLRLLSTVLAMPSTSLLARPGRRPGGGLDVTVGGSPEAATVAPGVGIITDTAAGGSFVFAIPASVGINLAARPTSGTSRIDEVIAVVKNVDVRPADGTREIDIQVITGTASASPTAPTITPAGALRLAELAVPASGTVSVSKPAQRIAGLGGVLPVASAAIRDAIEDIYDGLIVHREDLHTFEGRANGAWSTLQTATDTGWANITLHTGFTAGSGATPKKRTRWGNEVKLKGRVNGTFGASADVIVADAGAVPGPPERVERQISGNAAAVSCRAFVEPNGEIHVITGPTAPSYVYLDGLSGYMLD